MDNKKIIQDLVKEIQNLFLLKKYLVIIEKSKIAIKRYPSFSIFYNMLGLALSGLGKFNEAIIILNKGLEINNNDLAIINNLANAYKSNFNYVEAEKLYKLSISKNNNYINTYVNYGNLMRELNKFNEAIELYKTALNYNDQVSGLHYALAMSYQAIGDFRNSENHALKTISLDPKFTRADLLISRSRKYKKNDEHFLKMLDKIQNEKLGTNQKIYLYFAISKAFEDINEISKSYEFLKNGNDLKRKNINFNIDSESNIFKNIENLFSNIELSKHPKAQKNSKKIIFILGMPRSGTTLTEQILSAHSKVYGAGELPYLPTIINEKFFNNKNLLKEVIEKYLNNPELIQGLTDQYFSFLNEYKILENFITDKAPLNFLWIGFIKILFPNSKIIHCKRNPKDNCLSLYKNFFEGDLNFTYNLEELSKYYILYRNMMKFWKKKIPNGFLDLEYELLISNPKDEIKKLLDYCGLEWEDKCLDFSNNKTPIKTASVGQARKSFYSSSIKSFSKYEVFLKDYFRNL